MYSRSGTGSHRVVVGSALLGCVLLAGCGSTGRAITAEGATSGGIASLGASSSASVSSSASASPVTTESGSAVESPRIVALGDSFTAGFGFFDDGAEMSSDDFFSCVGMDEGPTVKNDPCSSNSTLRSTEGELTFAKDYGLANQVSWAAQVAKALGVPAEKYANLAISGSTAKEWAEDSLTIPSLEGQNGLAAVASLKPDLVLLTLGGNPTLGKVLTGAGDRCDAFDKAGETDKLRACFTTMITKDGTYDALVTVYTRLLDTTDAKVVTLTYPRVVPQLGLAHYSPQGLLVARDVLNGTLMAAVKEVQGARDDGDRLRVADPDFKVGLPPGDYSSTTDCFGPATGEVGTDGPSNQSVPTQELFAEDYATSGWCAGPAWMISADTGTHPNVAGYAEFARVALAEIASSS